MRGYGVLDFMVRTYRNNKALLKERKPLKEIYNENNLHYIKKRVQEKTQEFDPEKRRIFLEKFYARQKRARARKLILLSTITIVFTLLIVLLLNAI